MIELTRLGNGQPFLLNPDLIERIDCHVDSVVRLTNGVEYVVRETGDEIVELIITFRRQSIGSGPIIARPADHDAHSGRSDGQSDHTATVVELPSTRPTEREVPR